MRYLKTSLMQVVLEVLQLRVIDREKSMRVEGVLAT
jgi:hypothetical protein